ncbi:hypothetical protein ELS24_10415 [Achromobacter spanius]|uniref:hypothetical protein n=1 Tax=Achromobacter spanius TaxID=217203 RepID=UPI000F8F9771|nr:hypothetical protein [Achromobacter spanius]AZS78821.1 hypothetical protein ELS24_10415 [Achromobacter spanius]
MANPQRKMTPEQELRSDLEWDMRLALRDGKDVVFQYASGPSSEDLPNAIYQDSIGNIELVAAYKDAVQAFASGETHGRIGELFAKFLRGASTHYVETLASGIEDPEMRLRVTFQREAW